MSKSKTTYTGGTSIVGLLGIAFVVLKLCKVITWSWWWVTAPFWLPASAFIAFGLFCLFMALISGQLFNKKRK